MSSITISDVIDSGNITVVDIATGDVKLKIKDEPYTVGEMKQHKMWFNFKASGVKNQQTTFSIVNAGECSFPVAWKDYNVCTSYDRKEWFRTPTTYDEAKGHLVWSTKPVADQIYFAYFAPFSWERHCDLVAQCVAASTKNPFVPIEVKSVGKTLDGRDMDLIVIGDTSVEGHLKIWANARQHPGESQAEFWMEGYINRLLDDSDSTTRALMKKCVFYIVPNMNPDGSIRGHLRTNACEFAGRVRFAVVLLIHFIIFFFAIIGGANLNREWCDTKNSKSPAAVDGVYQAPTLERSPEVFHG